MFSNSGFGAFADTRQSLGAAAQAQAGAGVGQFVNLTPADNAAMVLPAGGTWKYAGRAIGLANGALAVRDVAGIAAGGSTVGAATAGAVWLGWAERVT